MLIRVLLALSAVVAKPLFPSYTVHERRADVPSGWYRVQRHDADAVLPLRIGLAQRNLDRIDEYINDVAHPDSANYGNHWSAERVAKTFAPTGESVDAVRGWLVDAGFARERVRVVPSRGWIEVNATVGEAERLLQTEYHVYRHEESGQGHVACEEYRLPEDIRPHVELILPTVHFDAVIRRRDSNGSAAKIGQSGSGHGPKSGGTIDAETLNELNEDSVDQCDRFITLACLRALYGIPDSWQPKAAGQNSLGIAEYTPEAYLQEDLDLFNRQFSPGLVGRSPILVAIDGAIVQTQATGFEYNGESALDLEYAMALVTPLQNVTLYQVGDIVEGASFNNFLDALDGSYCQFEGGDDPNLDAIYPDPDGGYQGPADCGTAPRTHVISTSYGYDESDLTRPYTARQCAEYAKLGLMGVTMLYSSGDYGVAGNGGECLPDSTGRWTRFKPSFPSTCPYVTSVGATQVNRGAKVTDPESACKRIIQSGGGFSNHFAMPSYQRRAVEGYMTEHRPTYPDWQWNSTGSRGYPDISANGADYVVAVDGEFNLVFGTSASTPVFAAILTMANDARLSLNKKPIGFINPVIYSDWFCNAFNDITTGDNPGCGTHGFRAVRGWDPVTGLGTPNLERFVDRWVGLP